MTTTTFIPALPADQRLQLLRAELQRVGVDAFIIKVGDEYQGEYVPDAARRLEWLSGFSGSAGMLAITADHAALFTDGRYTLQAKQELDAGLYHSHNSAELAPEVWLASRLNANDKLAYDPWLFTASEIRRFERTLSVQHITLLALACNPIDSVWSNRPAAPAAPIRIHPLQFSGESSADKRKRMAAQIQKYNADTLVIAATDSLNWLLNIRGSDVPFNPLALGFALLHADASLWLYMDAARLSAEVLQHLGSDVQLRDPSQLEIDLTFLGEQKKTVLVDSQLSAVWFNQRLETTGAVTYEADDPCQLAKACKNKVEIDGARRAHARDGVAVTQLLSWVDKATQALSTPHDASSKRAAEARGQQAASALSTPHDASSKRAAEAIIIEPLTELSVVDKALELRSRQAHFVEPSFATIAGSGPNGAIVHYRATNASNRALDRNTFLLVDSGGQYEDGTTDITRTIALGELTDEMKDRFTRVLKGHIALAMAQFPQGTTGGQLDALARMPLWQAGLDYDHGTGHGVGSFLNVHEGPQRIGKKIGGAALQTGMIISNEPGYYKNDAYGIRIENLVVVLPAAQEGFLCFETLTLVPIDRRAINASLLSTAEKDWLNAYHARVLATLSPQLAAEERAWLSERCRPL